MAWYTAGAKSLPADGTVLATTGAQPTGNYMISVTLTSTLLGTVVLERRDSTNVLKSSQQFKVLANETVMGDFGTVVLDTNDYLQLLSSGLTLAGVDCSLFLRPA